LVAVKIHSLEYLTKQWGLIRLTDKLPCMALCMALDSSSSCWISLSKANSTCLIAENNSLWAFTVTLSHIKSLVNSWNLSCDSIILSLNIDDKFAMASAFTSVAILSLLTYVNWLDKEWVISELWSCNSFNVSCSCWTSAIVAVPKSVFKTLPPKFTGPRLRSSRGKIWWKSWSFNSNNFNSDSIWRISDTDVNSFLFYSTKSKSILLVDIISGYVRMSMFTAIRQASFVKVMSDSFRKITLLFKGWTNGSSNSAITNPVT